MGVDPLFKLAGAVEALTKRVATLEDTIDKMGQAMRDMFEVEGKRLEREAETSKRLRLLEEKLVPPDDVEEGSDLDRVWHLANTMRETSERYKAERDELLRDRDMTVLAEQFLGVLALLQDQMVKRHPEGYQMIGPNGVVTLSTTGGTSHLVNRKGEDDEQ
jgi:hypothetical protein